MKVTQFENNGISLAIFQDMSFPTTLLSVILTSLLLAVKGQAPVAYEPEFLEELENHTVTQGRDVSFTCVVNHLGSYKVAWIKSDSKTILAIHTHLIAHNSRMSVTHNGHNTWKLKVSNVQKNDSGTYMCQINTDPMKSQVGYLEVVIPPDVLNEEGGDDHVTTEGGSVRLRCRATGSPEPKVMWKREDSKNIVLRHETGSKEVVKTFEGELLELSNIQRTEMGSYLCIASNGIPPSVSKRIIVQVHFHPVVKVPNQLVGAPAGSDVVIQCYVETSPKAMHSWLKETGEKLLDNSKYIMEEVIINDYTLLMNLTIKTLEKKDFGSYTCQSVNALGKAEGTVRLQELHIIKTTSAPSFNIPDGRGRKKPKDKTSQHLHGPPPPPPQPPAVPPEPTSRRRKIAGRNNNNNNNNNDDDDDDDSQLQHQQQLYAVSTPRSPLGRAFVNTLSPLPSRTPHAKVGVMQAGCQRTDEGLTLVVWAVLVAVALI